MSWADSLVAGVSQKSENYSTEAGIITGEDASASWMLDCTPKTT